MHLPAMRRLILLLLPTLFSFARASNRDPCRCGYILPNTSTPFTTLLETDFLHLSSLSTHSPLWLAQSYMSAPQSPPLYGKLAQPSNIILNPLPSIYDWGGVEGIHGGAPGLQLWVRSSPVSIPPSSPSSSAQSPLYIPISELVSSRDDILYGSFRVALLGTPVSGTCAAFFTYRNDSSEVDVEILSRQQSESAQGNGTVNFVVQSELTEAIGYVPPTAPEFKEVDLGAPTWAEWNEYRVDWWEDRVEFWVNGVKLATVTDGVPHAPARVHLIHWSDGNKGWSGGPPNQDAVVRVSYVKGYFNTTRGQSKGEGCKGGEAVCVVPDVTAPPDPRGMMGNITGRTLFLGGGVQEEKGNVVEGCAMGRRNKKVWKKWKTALVGTVVAYFYQGLNGHI